MSVTYSAYLVDWETAKPYLIAESFNDLIWDEPQDKYQPWIFPVEGNGNWNDNGHYHGDLCLAIEELEENMPEAEFAPLYETICRAIWDVEDKLIETGIPNFGGTLMVAISPTKLAEEVNKYKELDMSTLQAAYDTFVEEDTTQMISDWNETGVEPEGDLAFYLKQWINLFDKGVSQNKGVLVFGM